MPQFSDLPTKSFLGNTGAAENSYILINYEDNTTAAPITYKASLYELGQAIVNDQHLYKDTGDGAVTTYVSNNTYVDSVPQYLVTDSEKTILETIDQSMSNDSVFPVLYDNSNEVLKYLDGNNTLQALPISGGAFDPTTYFNEDDYTKLVFLNNDGELTVYNNGSSTTLSLDDLSSNGALISYDSSTGQLQTLDGTALPNVPFDLGTYTDPNHDGCLIFYDTTKKSNYIYDSNGYISEISINPAHPIHCLVSYDSGTTQIETSLSLVCVDTGGHLYAIEGSTSSGYLSPLTLASN